MAKKKKGRFWLWILVLAAAGALAYYLYNRYFIGKVSLKDKNYTFIYIGHNDSFEDVLENINAENIISDPESFEWLARKMKLPENIHAGKYRITNGMNMRQIINLVKYDKQEKVKLSLNSQIRTLDEFVEYADEKLELESTELEEFIEDENKLREYFGLSAASAFGIISPGAYEVSWAISAEELFKLLKTEFNETWNNNRRNQAKNLGYSITQIISLASIVQSESAIESEQKKIAGVYINRLKINMPLQADPTLKFANKAFDAQRFYNSDKSIDSPYNTYMYKGLPPGPICLVSRQAIDATLNHVKHKYLYFCAKPQLNGYSDFSVSFEQHEKYARAYQKAMDQRGINR